MIEGTAHHEAGHCVLWVLEGKLLGRMELATIVPRGRVAGDVYTKPKVGPVTEEKLAEMGVTTMKAQTSHTTKERSADHGLLRWFLRRAGNPRIAIRLWNGDEIRITEERPVGLWQAASPCHEGHWQGGGADLSGVFRTS